jgi:hypothetical protein
LASLDQSQLWLLADLSGGGSEERAGFLGGEGLCELSFESIALVSVSEDGAKCFWHSLSFLVLAHPFVKDTDGFNFKRFLMQA